MRRRTRTTSGRPRPANRSDAGSGVPFVGGGSPVPGGWSTGVMVTTAWIEPGAPPGWPGGVKLAICTEYLLQPVSSAPRTSSAVVGDVQLFAPGSKLFVVTLFALNRPAKLSVSLALAVADALLVALM